MFYIVGKEIFREVRFSDDKVRWRNLFVVGILCCV